MVSVPLSCGPSAALGGTRWVLLPGLSPASHGHLLQPKPTSGFLPWLGLLCRDLLQPLCPLSSSTEDGVVCSLGAAAPVRPEALPPAFPLTGHWATWGDPQAWESARASPSPQVSIQASPPKADAAGALTPPHGGWTRRGAGCQALQAELPATGPGATHTQQTAGQGPRAQLTQNICLFPRKGRIRGARGVPSRPPHFQKSTFQKSSQHG